MKKAKHTCDHPIECMGLALDEKSCGWCADLKDLGILMDHLSTTYDHFSGGLISKPMTLPKEVFAIAAELESERVAEAVKEELEALAD